MSGKALAIPGPPRFPLDDKFDGRWGMHADRGQWDIACDDGIDMHARIFGALNARGNYAGHAVFRRGELRRILHNRGRPGNANTIKSHLRTLARRGYIAPEWSLECIVLSADKFARHDKNPHVTTCTEPMHRGHERDKWVQGLGWQTVEGWGEQLKSDPVAAWVLVQNGGSVTLEREHEVIERTERTRERVIITPAAGGRDRACHACGLPAELRTGNHPVNGEWAAWYCSSANRDHILFVEPAAA